MHYPEELNCGVLQGTVIFAAFVNLMGKVHCGQLLGDGGKVLLVYESQVCFLKHEFESGETGQPFKWDLQLWSKQRCCGWMVPRFGMSVIFLFCMVLDSL